MTLLYRILLYGFPLFLLLAEALFKFSRGEPHAATSYYVALCSGATSLLLTSAIPKDVHHRFSSLELPAGCQLRSVLDERISAIAWIVLFVTLTIWMYFLAAPEIRADHVLFQFQGGRVLYTPDPFSAEFIATGLLYTFGVVATEVKERV